MSSLTDDVKNALSSVLSGAGDVVGTAQTVAKENVVKAVQGVGDVATGGIQVVSDVVDGGIQAILSTGTTLSDGVIGLVRGVVGGAKDVGINTTEAAGEAASTAIKTTAGVGGDVGTVAVSVVTGVIQAASDVGEDSGQLAKSAVLGAISAADEVGSEAGSTVRKALLGAAALPHDIIDAMLTGKTD